MASKREIVVAAREAARFDPTCVVLGTKVIDWGGFGWGNTVIITPSLLGVGHHAVIRAAAVWAKSIKANYATHTYPDGRVAVTFTRAHMVELDLPQGKWLGAVDRG